MIFIINKVSILGDNLLVVDKMSYLLANNDDCYTLIVR